MDGKVSRKNAAFDLSLLFSGIKIYYINLDRAKDRKAYVETALRRHNLEAVRFRAIDGSKAVLSKYADCVGSLPNTPRTGCLLSHLNLLKHIVWKECDDSIILILEDDVSFEFCGPFKNKDFSSMLRSAPQNWVLIKLSIVKGPAAYRKLKRSEALFVPNEIEWWSTLAYLVNVRNLKKKFSQYIEHSGRVRILSTIMPIADRYIYGILKTYVFKYPFFCSRNDNDSTVNPDLLDFFRECKHANKEYLADQREQISLDLANFSEVR